MSLPSEAQAATRQASSPESSLAASPAPIEELRRAVRRGDLEVARTLLEVDPSMGRALSASGGSLLLEAVEREHDQLGELFSETRSRTGGEDLDVHEACAFGRPGAVRRAITDDPLAAETVGPAGFLPLHRAAFRGDADSVMLLLETGADASARSENTARLSPLHSAVAGHGRARQGGDHAAVIRTLLSGGADPSAEMEGGWTPLAAATRVGAEGLIEALGGAPTDA
jgi:ankyrin repeat protein